MNVTGVEIRQLKIPMLEPLAAAHGSIDHRLTILVRVQTDVATGWGECVALNTASYRNETSDGEFEHLKQAAETILAGRYKFDAEHQTSFAAVESALLDASLKHRGESLAGSLGQQSKSIPVIGILNLVDNHQLLSAVDRLHSLGFRHFKLKVAPHQDVKRIALVNTRFPGAITRVDANGSYLWDNAEHREALKDLDGFGLSMIEQPLTPSDWGGLESLRSELRTPIALDESITGVDSALRIVDNKLCDVLVVKPGTVGGIGATKRLIESGAKIVIGGMVETAVSRSVNVALASVSPSPLAAEIAPDGRWFAVSMARSQSTIVDGAIPVSSQSGIGFDPSDEAISHCTVRSFEVSI